MDTAHPREINEALFLVGWAVSMLIVRGIIKEGDINGIESVVEKGNIVVSDNFNELLKKWKALAHFHSGALPYPFTPT
jgi:hypothetical protein